MNFSGKRYAAGDKVTINFLPDVPEPASWAMMVIGFGAIDSVIRSTRRPAIAAA